MGTLLLVRHAPTHASREGRNLGQGSNPGLSSDGLLLAQRLGVVLAAEVADLPRAAIRVVTAPAQRCRQTTRAIVSTLRGVPRTEVAPGLAEIDYGRWEGLTDGECLGQDPQLRTAWKADPFATRAPGGESGAEVAARAFPILREIQGWLEQDASRGAVVVTHNHVIRLWLTALAGWPMADYRRRLAQDPGGYNVIAYNGGMPQLRRVNAKPMKG